MRDIMRIVEAKPNQIEADDLPTTPLPDAPEDAEALKAKVLAPKNTTKRQSKEHPLAVEAKKYENAEDFANAQRVLYHGSRYELDHFEARGAFFTDDWNNADGYAAGEHVYEGYLILKNPLVIDCNGKKWDDLDTPYGASTQDVIGNVDRKKYDGVVFENVKDDWIDDADYQDPGTVYYAFNAKKAFINSSQLADFYNKAHGKSSKLTPS